MGKIIVIEGFWRIGKTALCKELSKRIKKGKYMQEPDHLKIRLRPKNVEYWYLKKWKEKMELAKKYKKQGYVVFMERSFVSTLAFNNALGRKVTGPMKKLIKYHEKNLPDITIVLNAPLPFLRKLIFSKADKKILKTRALYTQKKFFHKYIGCFSKAMADFKIKHFSVQVVNGDSFYPLNSIVEVTLKKLKERAPL